MQSQEPIKGKVTNIVQAHVYKELLPLCLLFPKVGACKTFFMTGMEQILYITVRFLCGIYLLAITVLILSYCSKLRSAIINQEFEQSIESYETAYESGQKYFWLRVDHMNPVSKVFVHFLCHIRVVVRKSYVFCKLM